MVLRQQFLGAGWLPVCTTWDAKRLWLFLQACAPSYTSLRFGFVWFFFFFWFVSVFSFPFTSRPSPAQGICFEDNFSPFSY